MRSWLEGAGAAGGGLAGVPAAGGLDVGGLRSDSVAVRAAATGWVALSMKGLPRKYETTPHLA
ncbi:hypothetical protein [Falsiroseomonas sp. E2-1-a4]|uniref:hypothetical protein n=1 Tax=Falsiroseomonas sp. E2-1-a4 TaxID=3239299 RepID=UPI003F2C71AA